jgi:hypothetical protein
VETEEQDHVKISKEFAGLENLDDAMAVDRTQESFKENVIT